MIDKEKIEEASRDFSNTWAGTPICKEDIIRKCDYESGFADGAIWRINRIWHDVSEKPKKGEMVLVLRGKYSPIICGPFNFDWKETVECFGLTKWAYIEDLLPDNE